MKKQLKRIIFSTSLTLVFITALHAKIDTNNNQFPSISLQNIEMLSSSEVSNNCRCQGVGSLDCPISKEKVSYVLD